MIFINIYNLELIQNTINNIHPKQLINKVGDIKISLFEIKYSYKTNRGNEKQGVKYLVNNSINPQINYKKELNEWVIDYNSKNEHRQISNVKFLGGQCLGYICL